MDIDIFVFSFNNNNNCMNPLKSMVEIHYINWDRFVQIISLSAPLTDNTYLVPRITSILQFHSIIVHLNNIITYKEVVPCVYVCVVLLCFPLTSFYYITYFIRNNFAQLIQFPKSLHLHLNRFCLIYPYPYT